MSNKRLTDFLHLERKPIQGQRTSVAAVISDSKGKYLKQQVVRAEDRAIYWWCQAGDNIEKRLRWLRRNIQNKVNELGSIHFYIWLGTCNLTTKDKSVYISLAFTETNDAIVVTTNLFKQFIDLVNQYPNCKLTFLEIPHYSIVRWNTTRGHRQPEVFATQDNTLHEQIEAINQVIHTLNREQGVRSPLLTVHLRARKQVKRGKNKPTKDIINFNLLSDGIHPSPLLAKVWLKEIAMRISVDCYQ